MMFYLIVVIGFVSTFQKALPDRHKVIKLDTEVGTE